jgi:aspartokinase-like uncharacterized kinase
MSSSSAAFAISVMVAAIINASFLFWSVAGYLAGIRSSRDDDKKTLLEEISARQIARVQVTFLLRSYVA